MLVQFLENAALWILQRLFPVPPVTLPTDTPYPVLTQTILTYNNAKPYWALGPIFEVPPKSVIIHKIDATAAEAIAYAVTVAAAKYSLPIPYVLACLGVESVLDPQCQNGNTGPGESNTANDPLGYDMGLAQLKLRYLVGIASGVTDAASAKAFAFDVTRAVPYFCSLMAGKIETAKQIIAANTSSVPDPRMNNPYILGTWLYNEGDTGGKTAYESGQFPNHCASVLSDWLYFASKLSMDDVPKDLQ